MCDETEENKGRRRAWREGDEAGREKLQCYAGLLWSGFDPDIWALVLPSLVSLMIEPAMSLVDSIIIGRIGAAALGGCGISVYLCSGVTLLFSFLAMVSTPAVASALARQDVAQCAPFFFPHCL